MYEKSRNCGGRNLPIGLRLPLSQALGRNMSDYTGEEKADLMEKRCPDCQSGLRQLKGRWYCGCGFFISQTRLDELGL